MLLYKTSEGNVIVQNNIGYLHQSDWTALINRDDLHGHLSTIVKSAKALEETELQNILQNPLAPISQQEVWAAGVTYLRSRDARMEESKETSGSDCYERVYMADRPELFFKSMPHRVANPNEEVYIRKDSKWNVPEPELTLYINSNGKIQAYTVGNDMSSRDIEGENPLYLPQAKMYERSVALGPCLYVPAEPIAKSTTIKIIISRNNQNVFEGTVTLEKMKRQLKDLAGWLFKELRFAHGAFLLTGTGLVPLDHFTLEQGDVVSITIENIGTLTNTVAHA